VDLAVLAAQLEAMAAQVDAMRAMVAQAQMAEGTYGNHPSYMQPNQCPHLEIEEVGTFGASQQKCKACGATVKTDES
jgi:hypothetical protein